MTTTTQINITAKDQTAGAFSSASNNLSELASSALKTTAGLAGIGLSIAGAVDAVKGIAQATIQFQQFTSTLQVGTGSAKGAADAIAFVRSESQRLGLDLATAADQFGKLSAASKGTALEGKATRDIFSSVAAAATAMGLSADQTSGSLLAIQQIISKGTVSAEELRGQLGERLPGAFQIAARSIGVTTQELDKLLRTGSLTAEQLLPALSAELNKTFGAQSEQAAQGLTSQMNRMNTAIFDLKIAIGESGLINFLSSGIELATKLSNALTSAFGGGQKLTAVEKQVSLIQTLESELESLQNLTHIPLIGNLLFDKKQADLLKFRIESATEDLGKMKSKLAAEAGTETVISQAAAQAKTLSVATNKTISDADRFISALRKEAETVGLTTIEVKRLEAANLGVSSTANPLISNIEQVTSEMDQQKESARALADDMRKIASITESVKTSEEKLIDTQTELDRLMKSGLGIETYNRALKKAQDETSGVTVATRNTTDEVSQLWVQAGRNIQSTLANSIFNFFDDGLSGMLKNVISTVGRIASEFAALKIAQSVGLAGIFGGGIGGTGAATGGASLLSNVGSGAGIAGLLKNAGGGITSGISGLISGGGVGALALPLIGGFALNSASNAFAGDKTLGNGFTDFLQKIPVLGAGWDILAGFFGREPYKFRQQSIQGTASGDGFDGDISNVFRSKGGVFSGNKHSTKTEQFSLEQQDIFDTTISGFYKSAHSFAKNLGLSTDLVDNFTQQVQIKSEKGKTVTEEAIAEMIAGIGESLAKNLIPSVDEFRKVGEDSFTTFTRLNAEFVSLVDGVKNLGGSADYAKSLIRDLSFDTRTSFVEMAGGLDGLKSLTEYFANNYLTQAERIAPVITELTAAAKDLGFAYTTDVTREQVKALAQSQNISAEARIGLLKLLPAFDLVKNTLDSIYGNGNKAADSLNDFASNLQSIKSNLASTYQNERNGIESTISKFKDLAGQLRGFRDSLSLGALSPLTPGQKLDEARNQFNQVRTSAAGGDQDALAKLPSIAQDFLTASQTYNASGAAYLSDFSMVQSVLADAEGSSLSQIDIAQSQLSALDESVKYLVDIKDSAKTTNELLADLKIAVLSSSGNPGITTDQIKSYLSANPGLTPDQVAKAAAQYGVSGGQLSAAGYNTSSINQSLGGASVSDQQIKAFVDANKGNPMAIYNAAVANGVSSSRLSKVSGIALTDIQKFVKDNNLPSFAKGTDFISRSGLAMVHRAEAIVPSSTTDEIKKLREEMAGLRAEQNRQTGDMINVAEITSRQNAQVIAKAMADAEKNRQWSDRSKAALA